MGGKKSFIEQPQTMRGCNSNIKWLVGLAVAYAVVQFGWQMGLANTVSNTTSDLKMDVHDVQVESKMHLEAHELENKSLEHRLLQIEGKVDKVIVIESKLDQLIAFIMPLKKESESNK